MILLKVATLAPTASPWGQVFTVFQKVVKEKSGGRLGIEFFYNGQQGDEGNTVGKMKAGQLDGAALTAVGLGKIYKPILALELPGLFTTWAKLDAARDAMKAEFEKGVTDAGFTLAGWGGVGQVHIMSKGFPIKLPGDLAGKKPFRWRDDPMALVMYQVVGGVTSVPLNVPEVLSELTKGALDVVIAPALAAEQLQWSSRLDHIVSNVSASAIGALVFSTQRLDGLPADLRALVIDTGKAAAAALTARIPKEDAAAYGRMKDKMTVVTFTADQAGQWETLYKQIRLQLSQDVFSPELVAKLEALAK